MWTLQALRHAARPSKKIVQIPAAGILSLSVRERRMALQLNRTSNGIVVGVAMILALTGLEPRAAAAGLDKKSSADAKKATQLYKQGSYEEAAAVFLQLSVDNPDMPVFVRNLGACYYYLRRPDPALSNLREYLHKKKDIAPDDSAEVEGWIAEMDQLRQHGSTPAAAPVPIPAPVPVPAPVPSALPVAPIPQVPAPAYTPLPPAEPPAAPVVMPDAPPAPLDVPAALPQTPVTPAPIYTATPPAPGPAVAVAQVPPPRESGSGRKTAAWVLGGVGVAGLVAGGFLSYLASSNFSDIENKYDPGKHNDGKTYANFQWLGYGVGGAAIVTAVILLATGRDAPKSVALAPAVGPGMAGAALSGTF
jgi:tetratricopeptide (TPR) repeat protein